jgi:hypothetical protein
VARNKVFLRSLDGSRFRRVEQAGGRVWRRIRVALFVGAVLSPLLSFDASAAPGVRDRGPWHIQSSPSPGTYDRLYGTAAIDPEDVWAVGRYIDKDDVSRTLIEHWNGTSWGISSNAVSRRENSYLFGVAATPHAPDLWAVGYTANLAGSNYQTLVEHSVGRSWSAVATTGPGLLAGVAALSPDDVWVVGDVGGDTGTTQTLTEHWDGTQWSVVSSPDPGGFGDGLAAVTAISANDVWAVGSAGTTKFNSGALVEHWNGEQWQAVPTPPIGEDSDLRDIAAVSANDIWAVGVYDLAYALVEHWDGRHWRIVSTPNPTNDDILQGVAALSPTDVWAVGSEGGTDDLTMQWDGTDWSIVPSPHRPDALNSLASVSVDVQGGLWATGFDLSLDSYAYGTLIEHAVP